ncbi:MAG: hypothetical protein ACRD88_22760 [Terriglobia bacterium]
MRTTALLAADTSLKAERAQVEIWRRMLPIEKLCAVTEISRAAQQLSLAGIRLRHPAASDGECLMRLAILKLGRRLACQVYPQVARLRGR